MKKGNACANGAHISVSSLDGTRNGHWCLIHLPVISLPPGRRNTLAIAHQQSLAKGATTKTQLIIVVPAACMCLFVCRCICAPCTPCTIAVGSDGYEEWVNQRTSQHGGLCLCEWCVALRVCPTRYPTLCAVIRIQFGRRMYSERWVGRHGESKQGVRTPVVFHPSAGWMAWIMYYIA